MSVKVYQSGAWKEASEVSGYSSGEWQKIKDGYVRKNGVWQKVYSGVAMGGEVYSSWVKSGTLHKNPYGGYLAFDTSGKYIGVYDDTFRLSRVYKLKSNYNLLTGYSMLRVSPLPDRLVLISWDHNTSFLVLTEIYSGGKPNRTRRVQLGVTQSGMTYWKGYFYVSARQTTGNRGKIIRIALDEIMKYADFVFSEDVYGKATDVLVAECNEHDIASTALEAPCVWLRAASNMQRKLTRFDYEECKETTYSSPDVDGKFAMVEWLTTTPEGGAIMRTLRQDCPERVHQFLDREGNHMYNSYTLRYQDTTTYLLYRYRLLWNYPDSYVLNPTSYADDGNLWVKGNTRLPQGYAYEDKKYYKMGGYLPDIGMYYAFFSTTLCLQSVPFFDKIYSYDGSWSDKVVPFGKTNIECVPFSMPYTKDSETNHSYSTSHRFYSSLGDVKYPMMDTLQYDSAFVPYTKVKYDLTDQYVPMW